MMAYDPHTVGVYGGWRKYPGNPIIGPEHGETFDATVLELPDRYRMYLSWRSTRSIAYTESRDGIHWGEIAKVLEADPDWGWQTDVNRQSVVLKHGEYHMWYAGQTAGSLGGNGGGSWIGYAQSEDGIHWRKRRDPVLCPDQPWEMNSLMCPHVLWDETMRKFRMWYSAGEWFEPDAIGYAESDDGIVWEKHAGNPVLGPVPDNLHERKKVAACQVVQASGWHFMFYISYEDEHKATISAARSPDGIARWQRHRENPLITCGVAGAWDAEAIYKPFVIHRDNRWILWYNGNARGVEHIGMAIHEGDDLGFD